MQQTLRWKQSEYVLAPSFASNHKMCERGLGPEYAINNDCGFKTVSWRGLYIG